MVDLAYSFDDTPSVVDQVVYTFSLIDGYISESDLNVYYWNTSTEEWDLVDEGDWSLTGEFQITFSAAPQLSTTIVRVRREVAKNSTYSQFTRGGDFDSPTMLKSFRQALHVTHEAIDGFFSDNSAVNVSISNIEDRLDVLEASDPTSGNVTSVTDINLSANTDSSGTDGGLNYTNDSVAHFTIDNAGAAVFVGSVDSASLNITNNIVVGGTVDGVDIAALNVIVGGVTAAEMDQIENINVVTISNSQWVIVGDFDQALSSSDIVGFADVVIPDGGTVGQVTGPLLEFDNTNNYLEITGCNVGIGSVNPTSLDAGITTEISSITGGEVILTRVDTSVELDDFIGGFAFKNTDSTGSPAHYAGIKGISAGTSGKMNLELYAGDTAYEIGTTPYMILLHNNMLGLGTKTPVALNAGVAQEVSSITGGEIILTRVDSDLSANDFIGGFAFKNTDVTGSTPHYAGMKGISAGVSGKMNLELYAGDTEYETGTTPHMSILFDGGLLISNLKSGATQGAAGAAANELWITSSHSSQEDNTIMIGV